MLRDEEAQEAAKAAAPACCLGDCGDAQSTCVAWGRRLCYPHFADYLAWSTHLRDRAPTAGEWSAFLAWVADNHPEPEGES